MVLTEVHRDLNCDRLSAEALKWIILHMSCDQPDRYADAMKELNAHMIRYPESRKLLMPIRNGDRCCTDGLVCQCNTNTCSCKCAGCMCDF